MWQADGATWLVPPYHHNVAAEKLLRHGRQLVEAEAEVEVEAEA